MLAREQWDKPSLEDFIAWLETKPVNEKYEWNFTSRCACAQYAESIGHMYYGLWSYGDTKLWDRLNQLAWIEPRTFGGLLERALEAKAERGKLE